MVATILMIFLKSNFRQIIDIQHLITLVKNNIFQW